MFPAHRKIRCAWPTKPEERNARFDGLAQGYLAAVRAFDDAPGKATYNAIIANCVACHSVACGGVLEFIGSMQWQ
jgi:mono/diheme cytochrome c family protein